MTHRSTGRERGKLPGQGFELDRDIPFVSDMVWMTDYPGATVRSVRETCRNREGVSDATDLAVDHPKSPSSDTPGPQATLGASL